MLKMKIMRTHNFKSWMVLSVLLLTSLGIAAQTLREEDKKEFLTNSSTELTVKNQFGNITVKDWDQNKIVITYIIEVTHSDEAKAKKLKDQIKIEFKEQGNHIIANTIIGDDGNLKLNNSKGEKQSMKIDYFVNCPKGIKINLENQFGDMIISSLTGSFTADLQFGSLNAVSIAGPENKLDVQFGKVTIGSIKDAKFDLQHCDLTKIQEAANLSVDAQFSKLEMGSVISFTAELSHSDVNIEYLKELLKLDLNMGNVKIGSVSADFKSIIIDQNMGDLSMSIDPKAGYQLVAEVNMGSIKLPEDMKVSKDKEGNLPGISDEKISGTYGDGSSKVKIDLNMGSVRIK